VGAVSIWLKPGSITAEFAAVFSSAAAPLKADRKAARAKAIRISLRFTMVLL
jgi:hypothetical protein